MDSREGMSLQGSAQYYLNRGEISGNNLRPAHNVHGNVSENQTPQSFRNLSIHHHNLVGMISGGGNSNFSFHGDDSSPNFSRGPSLPMMPGNGSHHVGESSGKKKRGRPRKYGPGETPSLRLSSSTPARASGENVRKGRPPGSGWKQKLAPLGEWMNSSAGLAFSPHVVHVRPGEDVAAKLLAFAQQRSRALCIMSGGGSVSSVTLRQPTNSGENITYEGRFEILCLSGSYLVDEGGGSRDRTGGISISACTPDGNIIGGEIGGELIASSLVNVVLCSFVYGNAKAKSSKVERASTN